MAIILPENFPDEGLIKTTDEPNTDLSSKQKVHLNRKGNELFNKGEIDSARRIFQTTDYSDGLIRVGEFYVKEGQMLEALKMFKLSHEQTRCNELTEKAAFAIRKMLDEEEET